MNTQSGLKEVMSMSKKLLTRKNYVLMSSDFS